MEPSPKRWLGWLAVFMAAAALYLSTAQRGVAWQDSAIFQWRIHVLDLRGFMGIALAHPLLIVLGKLASLAPPDGVIWRCNAVSALAAALATANLWLLVRRLAPQAPLAAVFSAGAFALAHTVWWLATITESHALLAALLSGELLVLTALVRRRRLWAAAALGLLNGLGFSTHGLALLALPAYGLTVIILAARRRLSWWAVPGFILAWSAGAALVLWLVADESARVGLLPAVGSALFGSQWQGSVLHAPALALVRNGLMYIVYNFPNLALPLALVGLWRLREPAGALGVEHGHPQTAGNDHATRNVLVYLLGVHFIFAIRYDVPDQFMFFVPLYFMLSLLAGLGLASPYPNARAWLKAAAMLSLLAGPFCYAAAPAVAHRLNLRLPGGARALPYRDNARYWLSPWKHDETSAELFAREACEQLVLADREACVFADNTTYWPLRWVAQGELPEELSQRIFLKPTWSGPGADDGLLDLIARHPQEFLQAQEILGVDVYVVSNAPGYCPAALLPYVDDLPTGVLYPVRAGEPSLGD